MVTGAGMYLTKHSLGIYGGEEPRKPWDRHRLFAMETEEFVSNKGFVCKGGDGPNKMRFSVVHRGHIVIFATPVRFPG